MPYILDYHILASELRRAVPARGPERDEGGGHAASRRSKGEAWPGQHEINFRYADALKTADDHVVYKTGLKEIAYQRGCSVTFMAKPRPHVGRLLVSHPLVLWRDGKNAFAGESDVFKHYLAGQIACAAELAIFVAPTINSYKRFAAGSWAPTTLAWGYDNRTCGFRIVGHGSSLRAETRIPGADANPYLAFAALIAAGPVRDRARARARAGVRGQRVRVRRRAVPARAARGDRARSRAERWRAALLGDEVVDHYLNYARTEQRLFDEVVTGYERERMFERG